MNKLSHKQEVNFQMIFQHRFYYNKTFIDKFARKFQFVIG